MREKMLLSQLNKYDLDYELSGDRPRRWYGYENSKPDHYLIDPTGHNDWLLSNLAHRIGCKCDSRRIDMYSAYVGGLSQREIGEQFGVSKERVGQLIVKVVECKRLSWRPKNEITDADAARYLYQVLAGISDRQCRSA
jgi:hypothetical protein